MKITDLKTIKNEIVRRVNADKDELIDLSMRIHSNPETGYKEDKAVLWLSEYLNKNGFKFCGGLAGLRTAFNAKYGSGSPVIAILAEYDALPELGHACGHNIIGAAAAGAAMAAKVLVDNLPGTVVVYGTPAEEVFGGKIDMMEHGEFDHVDVAMMTHPDSMNSTVIKALACAEIDVEFTGKAAHAAAEPHLGINALDAMVLSFNNIGALRQHIKHDARIHGIIKYGGNAANIIPEYSSALFMVRASDRGYLEDLQKKIVDCFVGAALATGCQLSYKWGAKTTDPMRNNLTMARLYKNNMELLGRKMEMDEGGTSFGSTDMGNVSQIIPSIHPTVQIVSPGIAVHSREFAAAAISEDGNKGLLDAAKAMAMTVSDIIGNPETLEDIKDEFERSLKEPNLIPRL